MAVETISTIISVFGNALNTASAFTELVRTNKGEARVLLEELKKNNTLCWLVTNRESKSTKIIPKLSVKTYSRLLEKGFDFNKLSMVRELLGHLKSRPALVIGDRSDDIEAAHRNGLRAIAATYGYGTAEELQAADVAAHSPSDLPGLVRRLLAEKAG